MGKDSKCARDEVKRLNRRHKVIAGINDMATTHPELATECLDDPKKHIAGTNKRLRWKCGRCGYKWTAQGNGRVAGKGCSCCSNKIVVPSINDMATTHPELAKECLDDPKKYVAGTRAVLRWKCRKCGHKYSKSGLDRTAQKIGCGICTGRAVVPGVNDMATTHPELAKECLDDPTKYLASSHKKLWWVCQKGHRYDAVCANRSRLGTGCRFCLNLDVLPGFNDMATTHPDLAKECLDEPTKYVAGTHALLLWKCGRCGFKWRTSGKSRVLQDTGCACCSNKTVAPGINDMATTHPHLAKECLDDPTKYVAGTNKVLRWKCGKCGFKWRTSGDSRAKADGTGCACCSNKALVAGFNDMATTHPELAKECLHDPRKHIAGTNKRLRWKCAKCGHKWLATGYNRLRDSSSGNGCGCCSNKIVVAGINDMATTHPELAKECLDDPSKYVAGTNEYLRWKCGECGFKWRAPVNNRVQGRGCSKCAKHGYDQSETSVFYLITRPGQFKLGIMNLGTGRLNRHSKFGWITLDTIEMPGELARSLETVAKRRLKAKGIPTGAAAFREKFEGYSEAWQSVDLEVKSIRGLCRRLGVKLENFLTV
jgi:hypothetical protein